MTQRQSKHDEQEREVEDIKAEARRAREPRGPGHFSNSIIRVRNGGIPHKFENSIGGCGDNYR